MFFINKKKYLCKYDVKMRNFFEIFFKEKIKYRLLCKIVVLVYI